MTRLVSNWKPGWWLWLVAMSLWLVALAQVAWGQSALLPNAQQTFFGSGGAPLALGFVYMYVPGTTTPKLTWQDPKLTVPNVNPIVLDSNGQARIWGQGQYRQIVQDSLGNTVYDQITSADGEAGSGAWVPTNAALKALLGGAFTYVNRGGFAAAGDGGALTYYWQSGNCSLNSGNGDNGAQVKPTSGGGCWVADWTSVQASPLMWGCKGDGATNDSTCFQNAVSFLEGNIERTLWLGPHQYCLNGIITNQPIHIKGESPGTGSATSPSALIACSGSGTMISLINGGPGLIANGSILEDFAIQAAYLGSDTNTAISQILVSNITDRNLVITEACVGIDEGGTNDLVDHVHIVGSSAPTGSCGGINVGRLTSGGATSDFVLTNSYIHVNNDWGLRVWDADRMFVSNTDIETGANGVLLWAFTAGQFITNFSATNSVFGNGNTGAALKIDTQNGATRVRELNFNNVITANSGTDSGVWVGNDGSGDVNGIHFLGHRSYGNNQMGFNINQTGVVNTSIDSSLVCGNGVYGILLGANVANVQIRNNTITSTGGQCTIGAGVQTLGIAFGSGVSNVLIVGNDLRGNLGWPPSGSLSQNPSNSSSIIMNNLGLDDQPIAVTTTSTLNLPPNPVVTLAGTTPVTNMSGNWYDRTIQMITKDGPVAFQTGGAGNTKICNALTSVQDSPVIATYINGLSCWALK